MYMRTRRLVSLLIAPVALAMLAGCSPTPYTEPEPPKFTASLGEVQDASRDVVDDMIAELTPHTGTVSHTTSSADPNYGTPVFTIDDEIGRAHL